MQRPSARVLAFLFFCVLLTTVAWLGARWLNDLPSRLTALGEAAMKKKALEIQQRFFEIANFHPRTRVREKLIAETTSAIAEIAVLEKDVEVEREFVHTWAGSTKTLRLRGKYGIKVGFNLLDRFEIRVEEGKNSLVLPPAVILSVEQKELHVDALENGYWNPISADDLQLSVAALQAQARTRGLDLLPQAEKSLEDRLRQISNPQLQIIPFQP